MIEFRRPAGGQLLLLSLIPTLLLYHTYVRETALSTGEVVFAVLAFCLMVVSIVVEGFLESQRISSCSAGWSRCSAPSSSPERETSCRWR